MIAEHPESEQFKSSKREIHDWHHDGKILWYEGNINLLSSLMASVVGTRQASPEGIRRTQRLTDVLVQEGFTIVSGLAAGIDAAAHEQTLRSGGNTIAVMGTPIDSCYPTDHTDLKNSIAAKGLVISQFPPGFPTLRSNFPQRNILMAALSAITFVVEADANSGTRHQVKAAVKMGRRVGFLASLADRKFPWVTEALRSGNGVIVDDVEGLVDLLRQIKQIEPPEPFLAEDGGARIHDDELASVQECKDVIAYWSSLISIDERGTVRVIGRADRPADLIPVKQPDLDFGETSKKPAALEPAISDSDASLEPPSKRRPVSAGSVVSPVRVSFCKRLWNSFAFIIKKGIH